jgi:multimeric flavodoxin WrbA
MAVSSFSLFMNMREPTFGDEIAGSPWGAGTFAGDDRSRQPSVLEQEIANRQGKAFYEIVSKVHS